MEQINNLVNTMFKPKINMLNKIKITQILAIINNKIKILELDPNLII